MKFYCSYPLVTAGLAICLANPALAQMRPVCGFDPDLPGVCFEPTNPGAQIHCGAGEAGVLQIFNADPAGDQFKQQNPDGTTFVHVSRTQASFGFCLWADILSGNCLPPATGAFLGSGSFVLQGVVNQQGYGCPLRYKGSGMVYRAADNQMLEIDLDVQKIPDYTSPSGCATQVCRILAAD